MRENLDLTERPYRLTDPEDTELRLPAQRGWEQHTWSAQTFHATLAQLLYHTHDPMPGREKHP